jgi:hypothetical protein
MPSMREFSLTRFPPWMHTPGPGRAPRVPGGTPREVRLRSFVAQRAGVGRTAVSR